MKINSELGRIQDQIENLTVVKDFWPKPIRNIALMNRKTISSKL